MKLSSAVRLGAICFLSIDAGSLCRAQPTIRIPVRTEEEQDSMEKKKEAAATKASAKAAAIAATGAREAATKAGKQPEEVEAAAKDAAAAAAVASPAASSKPSTIPCQILPLRSTCLSANGGGVNQFWSTDGPFSFLSQIKSIYNSASGSATVAADLASLNFPIGMQATFGTNVQAGSSNAPTVASSAIPTLSATGAAQATQNMLYGGTLFGAFKYPLVATGVANLGNAGAFGMLMDVVGKGGADIQNFKSGTSITVNGPPAHASAQIEGYLQYNAINPPATGSGTFAGSLFLGGSYGYSYTSKSYISEYGFGSNVNNGLGQISAGVMINNVARISVSRAFGPSQTYIDSASMSRTTVNYFKSWSIGITYQSPPPPASK